MKNQMVDQAFSNSSLIKALAANGTHYAYTWKKDIELSPLLDRVTRARAVQKLRQYLSFQQTCSETEFLKLWKGLFYCMWMSDRPLTQQRLASDLANLIDNINEEAVIPFLSAFWKTMAREWRGIDVFRMNKFLLLVRYYFRASIKYFIRRNRLLGSHMDVLANVPLNPTDSKIPDGLRYHLIDIYVDELDNVSSEKESKMPLEIILEPIRSLGRQSPNRIVRKRVKELLKDPRLVDWENRVSEEDVGQRNIEAHTGKDRSDGDENNEEEEDEWSGIED